MNILSKGDQRQEKIGNLRIRYKIRENRPFCVNQGKLRKFDLHQNKNQGYSFYFVLFIFQNSPKNFARAEGACIL